jgi:hypothetical protein
VGVHYFEPIQIPEKIRNAALRQLGNKNGEQAKSETGRRSPSGKYKPACERVEKWRRPQCNKAGLLGASMGRTGGLLYSM